MATPNDDPADPSTQRPHEAGRGEGREPPDTDKPPPLDTDKTQFPPHATPFGYPATSAPTDVAPVSDDEPQSESTLAAPSYPTPMERGPRGQPPRPELGLRSGETIEDFKIVDLIGRGAFGGVYLARQLTLDRLVALKITANRGSEGRTLAQLEHDFIVQVFSETVDTSGRFRLLCMQLVPGSSLEYVNRRLRALAEEHGGWGGSDYLAAIDAAMHRDYDKSRLHDAFNPTALRDRELLGGFDDVQTTAWVGARLAEAVDHAHRRKVLHRDIKPANVLVNRYGRPLLADFNIAQRSFDGSVSEGAFGGTIAFMAPEHLDAFNPRRRTSPDEVDERSDLYSLGIVIHEVLNNESPFDGPPRGEGKMTFIGKLADTRRTTKPPISKGLPSARKVMERTIARTLEPEKDARYQSGADLAAALEGAGALRAAERRFPRSGWLTLAMQRNALLWLAVLVVVPQLISSAVNISYNLIEIVGKLTDEQRTFFQGLVLGYNAVVYPVLLSFGLVVILPVFRVWSELHGRERVDAAAVDSIRRRALRLPLWMLLIVAAGWLPGGLIFPLVIDWRAGPLDWTVYAHFVTSFTLSGLIAAAYSFGGLQFLVLRVMYPGLWADATDFNGLARRELAGSLWRVRFIPTLAYSIPVVAAMIILTTALFSPMSELRPSFLGLCVVLNLLGLLGSLVAGTAARSMSRTLVAMIGSQA